jgi:hypothetical protein
MPYLSILQFSKSHFLLKFFIQIRLAGRAQQELGGRAQKEGLPSTVTVWHNVIGEFFLIYITRIIARMLQRNSG